MRYVGGFSWGIIGVFGGKKILDTFTQFLANISVYWTSSHPSWPIYPFIGHVRRHLGQYPQILHFLSSTIPRF